MEKKLVETASYKEPGFKAAVRYGGWRIGILNYCEGFGKDSLNSYEKHFDTDEAFVLLSGKAVLFLGDGEDTFGTVQSIEMCQGTIYNIKKNIWHTQVMSEDGSILVVENADTGLDNSQVVTFDAEFRQKLYAACKIDF